MAVITEIPGVKVTVEVDGVLSQEYEDADGPSSDKSRKKPKYKCYKYIQSSDDAHFSVVYEVDNHNERVTDNALALYLFVDGEQMDSTLWEASRFGATGGHWRHPVTGTRATSSLSGMDAFRKFKFSKITTIDDAGSQRVETDAATCKSMGLIQVFVYGCTVRDRTGSIIRTLASTDKSFEVAEKALKGRAVSHGTSYTDGGLVPQTRTVSVDFLSKHPMGAYNFKYRSRDALRNELIIPRSPSPGGIEGLSDAEIRRLAAERLKSLNEGRRSPRLKQENKMPPIKREAEFLDLTEEPVKWEWKKIKIDNGREAIDLTDD